MGSTRRAYRGGVSEPSKRTVRPPGSCHSGAVTAVRCSISGRAAISSSLRRYAATTRIFETIRTFIRSRKPSSRVADDLFVDAHCLLGHLGPGEVAGSLQAAAGQLITAALALE